MTLPRDYSERVYAGVLGKIVGVYLGRPFEGWTYERIMEELGEVWYYVNQRRNVPLIVTDDDLSGTFTFLRAFPDYGNHRDLTPAQIGQTWLNYIIDRRTILWWGGVGNSTEQTAFMRLQDGIQPPHSGSIALNSKVVAEQIGSQIFIDGWAMVAPGDPAFAADLARRAACVSHDGEAIYGAQIVAALEAQAFVEADLDKLLDTAVRLIPADSTIFRMIGDIREWHAGEPDWHKTRARIADRYGYDNYGGNCHMVPNHALIVLALLYGGNDLQKSLMIVNTSGWDTDCNSGNVGCIQGIRLGLAAFDTGPDWRAPIADRLYLPTADGGRAITDALTETYHIVHIGRTLAGEIPETPKQNARFHFSLPGSVQGFSSEDSPDANGTTSLAWVPDHSRYGDGSLAIRYRGIAPGRVGRVTTPTFIPSRQEGDYFIKRGYALYASPTLYSGQRVTAGVWANEANSMETTCRLCATVYQPDDTLAHIRGPQQTIVPGEYTELSWTIPSTNGLPVSAIGIEISHTRHAQGTLHLDFLTWQGAPKTVLGNPGGSGFMWRRAWVDGIDQYETWWPEAYRLAQNRGRGLLSQGTREWTDYQAEATITLHFVKAAGLAVRYQGMKRFYALLLSPDGMARLVKALDGDQILAEKPFAWHFGESHTLRIAARGTHLDAWIDADHVFSVDDFGFALDGGGVALVVEEGRVMCEQVTIAPLDEEVLDTNHQKN